MILNNHIYNEHAPSRLLVYGLIASIIAICLVTIPYAHHHWPHLPAFVPLFAAFVMIIETLTAYLLIIQFRVSHQAHLVPLAGAYAFVAVMVTLQLLSFPGVFGENGILQGTNQSAVWMWVFWHGAFATLISLSLCLQLKYPDRKLSFRSGIGAFILAPLGACLLAFLSLRFEHLPTLIEQESYKNLSASSAGWTVQILNVIAFVLALIALKKRQTISFYILLAVLASLADVTLTLIATERYSVGWYIARILSVISSMSVLVGLLLEITRLYHDLAIANDTLLETSIRDGLTGLFNRRHFDVTAHKEWSRAQRTSEPLSVLIFDIDHFKAYNDTFGHIRGDACLRAVAEKLADFARRPADLVARYGGEEFVLILSDTTKDKATLIGEEARGAIESIKLPGAQPELFVTVSVGCATWHNNKEVTTFEELLNIADKALYKAKRNGRNQLVVL